jgi:hypothetical protein
MVPRKMWHEQNLKEGEETGEQKRARAREKGKA